MVLCGGMATRVKSVYGEWLARLPSVPLQQPILVRFLRLVCGAGDSDWARAGPHLSARPPLTPQSRNIVDLVASTRMGLSPVLRT